MRIEKCFACGKEFKVKGKHDLYCEDCREREVAKDNAIIENAEEHEVINLAAAILGQAGKDYSALIRKWRRAYENEPKKSLFIELQAFSNWWKGKGFKLWAGALDGAKVQKMLNTQVYQEIKMKQDEEGMNMNG